MLFYIFFFVSFDRDTVFVIHVPLVISLMSSNSYPIDKVLSDQTRISNPFRINVNVYFSDVVAIFLYISIFVGLSREISDKF